MPGVSRFRDGMEGGSARGAMDPPGCAIRSGEVSHNVIAFDVPTALQYAAEGRLEEWIHAYLTSGHWANPALSKGLQRERRWWNGPLELPLGYLSRCVGPEPGMEYPEEPAHWARRTARMAAGFGEALAIPPLIAEYRGGELSVRDGNTRHEAIRVRGWTTCWVVIWYNSQTDYSRHTDVLAQGGWLAPA